MQHQRTPQVDETTNETLALLENLDKFQRKPARVGFKSFIPIQPDRKACIESNFELINKILKPQWDSMDHSKTKEEMFAKMERKLWPWLDTFNECLYEAHTASDSNECSDRFIRRLSSEGIAYAKRLAKEY